MINKKIKIIKMNQVIKLIIFANWNVRINLNYEMIYKKF